MNSKKPIKLYLTSPTMGQVDIHYMRSVFLLQAECHKRKVHITLHLHKGSLVTFGRNACTAAFLHSDCTHMLFVDTDIQFNEQDIFRMIDLDKQVTLIPYPMKMFDWKKALGMYKDYNIPVNKGGFTYPMKILNPNDFVEEHGLIEIEKGPAGCMLIKREAILKMIEHYPELKVRQQHYHNESERDSKHSYNFWDTEFIKETGQIIGEDFAFCKRFRDIGGRIYALVDSEIAHHGNHPFKGRFIDECGKIE